MGYWASAVILSNTITTFFTGFIFASIGSFVSEMVWRKLNKIEL